NSLPYFAHRPVTFIMPPPSMQGGLEPHEAARFAKGKDGCGKVIAREETAVPTIRHSPTRTRSIPPREPDGDPDRGFRASFRPSSLFERSRKYNNRLTGQLGNYSGGLCRRAMQDGR